MTAPRELDRDVAEVVMAWEYFPVGYFSSNDETPRMRELDAWMTRLELTDVGNYFIDVPKDFFVHVNEWNPSTIITDAFTVVERMRARGYAVGLVAIEGSRDWRASFGDSQATRTTLPMAICDAALAACRRGARG